jgi:hypothetical protein
VADPARSGLAHHVWPGGLAVVFEGSGADTVAVFGPGGWEHGPRRLIFPQGPPPGAASSFLALPKGLVDQLAVQQFSGGALHTDFVFLDRLVRRFTPGTDDVVLLVVGRSPGALLCSHGQVTVIEPAAAADEPLHMLLPSLSGWIVMISGKVSYTATPAKAARDEEPAAPPRGRPPAAEPRSKTPPRESPRAQPPAPEPRAPSPPPAPAPSPAAPVAAADGQQSAARFGRFAADARFVLASGAAGQLPPEVSDQLAAIAGEGWAGIVALLDGGHTLAEVAATTGQAGDRVAGAVDVLVANKLAFKYVSRTRPQADAPTGPR